MSLQNDINAFEKVNNMKNLLGGSFIEYLKPNIKTKQNESVLKMLEIAKDKPETYLELLAVAIFHKNFEIIKYMIEHFKIMETDSPYMKASSFYNSILTDDSKDKINDSKDYIDIQIPFILMCGIGGDIEIFNYLLKHKLISNKDEVGVIGLSKKYKNTFSSNIIGACAYYGKKDLLEFLLKNYKNELKLNILTNEKKSKTTKYGFTKGGFACGPIDPNTVVTVKFKDGEGSKWISVVDVEGILNIFLLDNDYHKELVNEDQDDAFYDYMNNHLLTEFDGVEVGADYGEIAETLMDNKENPASQFIGYVINLTSCPLDETDQLIAKSVGKYADELDSPFEALEERFL